MPLKLQFTTFTIVMSYNSLIVDNIKIVPLNLFLTAPKRVGDDVLKRTMHRIFDGQCNFYCPCVVKMNSNSQSQHITVTWSFGVCMWWYYIFHD